MPHRVAHRKGACGVRVSSERRLMQSWEEGMPYADFRATVDTLRALWEGVYRTARIPPWAVERARVRGEGISLLAISEDWCWDAANVLPVLARLGDETGLLPLRLLARDANPDMMNRYLTGGSRSIPIVIALDGNFQEVGHWGPRPAALQAWALENRTRMPKNQFYAHLRRWHVQDRGESVLQEVLALLD